MFNSILVILITAFVIYFSGRKFATVSSEIGDYFNLSRAVKGATLDAIAGSFPELMIATFSVIFFHKFDVGVGTIAGSIFFNTLIIPGLAVLVSPVIFRVSREVMTRDSVFNAIAVVTFLLAILYSISWGVAVAVIFIGFYVWYVDMIVDQTEKFRAKNKKKISETKISITGKIFSAFVNMFIMGVAAYFLTKYAIIISQILNIPAVIIGFSVVAVATSIPNMVIAIVNVRKGCTDDVMSNVFGSNIFTIFIALGIPLFLSSVLNGGSVNIVSGGFEVLVGLFIATVVVLYFTIDDYIITKTNAVFLLIMYFAFIIYLFFSSVF